MSHNPKNRIPDIETVSFNDKGEIREYSVIRRFFLMMLIILISTLSFGLGRLSNEGVRGGVKIELDPSFGTAATSSTTLPKAEAQSDTPIKTAPRGTGEVVGSVKGTKYHFLYCSGAKQISEANKITFNNTALAEAAGYTLALNCKPR